MKKAIGGEFELYSLTHRAHPRKLTQGLNGSWTVSGRAAFCAILRSIKKQGIKKILLPAYLCESVVQPVVECDLAYDYYPVNDKLAALPQPEKDSAIVLIHYFGWLNPSTDMLRREAGKSFLLIEDMTQSVFSSWKVQNEFQSLVFFSLRKMGPVPMGGWYSLVEQLPPMTLEHQNLFWKSIAARLCKYIYLNLDDKRDQETEKSYLKMFHAIENTFDLSAEPYRLGVDAKNFIHGINWHKVAEVRRENWSHIHANLAEYVIPFHDELT